MGWVDERQDAGMLSKEPKKDIIRVNLDLPYYISIRNVFPLLFRIVSFVVCHLNICEYRLLSKHQWISADYGNFQWLSSMFMQIIFEFLTLGRLVVVAICKINGSLIVVQDSPEYLPLVIFHRDQRLSSPSGKWQQGISFSHRKTSESKVACSIVSTMWLQLSADRQCRHLPSHHSTIWT